MKIPQNMPTELLANIFFHCIPSTSLYKHSNGYPLVHQFVEHDPGDFEAELAETFDGLQAFERDSIRNSLMGVCRGWRNVILQSHKLWCQLDIDMAHFSNYPDELRALLRRSNSLEILITYSAEQQDVTPSNTDPISHDVMGIIRSEFSRIRVLAVNCSKCAGFDKAFVSKLFPRKQETELPILEHLLLYNTQTSRLSDVEVGSISAPLLKSCLISRGLDFVWESFVPSSLEQITHLFIGLPTRNPNTLFLELLAKCKSLRALSWWLSSRASAIQSTSPVSLAFPHLRSLSLHVEMPDDFDSIADLLDTPQLRSFTIIGYGYRKDFPMWIGHFLEKNPQLKEIRVDSADFQDCSVDILTPVSRLERLILSNSIPSKEFLRYGGDE
ncbi:hypothetical protein M422DRAFT_66695 [Sphaerobolus stellatus SS14]|uniref:F-box domain-containing protein n=1 Tax=Sphaerobolus stellatus (strain SS14) TaxID=990650 RepID=A0A0C9VI22_SPHS4|nr:hypothetical protein M422DRAFT_66695 [Sphaerobolus stellatus SS14]